MVFFIDFFKKSDPWVTHALPKGLGFFGFLSKISAKAEIFQWSIGLRMGISVFIALQKFLRAKAAKIFGA